VEEAAMAKVGLRDILSVGDRAAVMGLRRGPGQDQYLDSMEEIFAEADEEQRATHQVRGYGTATLDAVVDYLQTRPGADVLYTSCADGPGSPRAFYLGYGFTDTGRVMWGEKVLALDLAARLRSQAPPAN
jgi:hypothetical protein